MQKSKARILTVPPINKVETLIKWVNIYRYKKLDQRKYPAKLLVIDFSKCRFLKPYHIAPLACLIHEYHVSNYTIRLTKIPPEISDYFDSFNFKQFCRKEDKNNFPIPLNPKTLPLWKIEQEATSIYPLQEQKSDELSIF